jgi:hypothetical protein
VEYPLARPSDESQRRSVYFPHEWEVGIPRIERQGVGRTGESRALHVNVPQKPMIERNGTIRKQ